MRDFRQKEKKEVASKQTEPSPACPSVPCPWLDQSIEGTWRLQHSSPAVQYVLFGRGCVVRVFLLLFFLLKP